MVRKSLQQRERLAALGFRQCGEWTLSGDQIQLQLESPPSGQRVLYAFASGDHVLYLGKTTRGLRQRLQGYRSPGPTQPTNRRVNRELRSLLQCGEAVQILAWECDGRMTYGGFRIDLAAGLEDAIISELAPIWNDRK